MVGWWGLVHCGHQSMCQNWNKFWKTGLKPQTRPPEECTHKELGNFFLCIFGWLLGHKFCAAGPYNLGRCPSTSFSPKQKQASRFFTQEKGLLLSDPSGILGTFHSAFSLTKAPQIREGCENRPFSYPQRPAMCFFSLYFQGLTDQGKEYNFQGTQQTSSSIKP